MCTHDGITGISIFSATVIVMTRDGNEGVCGLMDQGNERMSWWIDEEDRLLFQWESIDEMRWLME